MKYSAEGLEKVGLELVPPFSLDVVLDAQEDLTDPVGPVEFKEVARVLPGRRISGIAEFFGRTYFVKVFVGPQARRYWRREIAGAQLLAKSGVASPAVLFQGSTVGRGGYVLFFAELVEASDVVDDDSCAIGEVVNLVAKMHEADLVQTDPHLGNFVRSHDGIFAVDADGIRRAQLLRVQFANLGMLLAQRRPIFDTEILALWQRYATARGEYVTRTGSVEQFKQIVKKQRVKRISRYLKKTRRECTAFRHVKTFRRNVLCDRALWSQKEMQRLCLFPETVFGDGTLIKVSKSALVVRMTIDDRAYIVKRYNVKSLAHRVRRWFKRRAKTAWLNGHLLTFLGVPTAQPVALIEDRFGWFVGAGYLVMPDCGARSLDQLLATEPALFDTLAPQTAAILQHLEAAGLKHGDLKANNFVVHENEVALIDFDSLQSGDNTSDIKRFLRNWEHAPGMVSRWSQALADRGIQVG